MKILHNQEEQKNYLQKLLPNSNEGNALTLDNLNEEQRQKLDEFADKIINH